MWILDLRTRILPRADLARFNAENRHPRVGQPGCQPEEISGEHVARAGGQNASIVQYIALQ